MGHVLAPCCPLSPQDPGTPMLTWLIFKSSSRDMLWSKCRVCHREASCWHCLQDGGMGLKTGQVRTNPSQEHVLTCAGKLHFAPNAYPQPGKVGQAPLFLESI